MKVTRQKRVRKTLLFYRNNFSIRPPYHVLVDGTFCKAALKFKVNISEQLPKYLDAEVKVQTTRCVIAECESFGAMLYGPLKVLKQYPVKECGHETPQPPVKCLRRMVKGRKCLEKFFIATQDMVLAEKVRALAGVPLLFISHNAITLEQPSTISKQEAETRVVGDLKPSTVEHASLVALKKQVFGAQPALPHRKKRRKIKGPNPLSCKKKKKASQSKSELKPCDGSGSVQKKARSRRRKQNNVRNSE